MHKVLTKNVATAPTTTTSSNRILLDYTVRTFKERLICLLHDSPSLLKTYILALFPILQWIHRYNLRWLLQDVIAGITVGMLIVPQGIAYAKIAGLGPQYGVTLYCFFGTSKDISIGPITVVSLLVGQAVSKITETHPDITGPEVAVCLSLFAGIITLLVGLFRLGILVDFISEPAIAGYMTGSAITISLGQWPKVLGLKQVDTHQSPYLIVYELFKYLKNTQLDAAFGLTALVVLYMIKWGGARLAQRHPPFKQMLFYFGIMRSGLVVIVGTLISFIIHHHPRGQQQEQSLKPYISIIQTVPAGFDAMGVPSLNLTVLKEASDVLPSIILILILEHVSVAKSFGRMSNYMIDPNQEILAIGISNLIGSFFGAYPATGAFSRTAVMSRSGAKTPMAGVFSGAVVVLALYALTPAFYYIPDACLAAVVIHAVIDLVSGRTFLKALWRSSILEFLIFVTAVVITCFRDVETAIYVSVALSLLLMLLRLARPKVSTLGRVRVLSSSHSNHPLSASLSPSYASRITTTTATTTTKQHGHSLSFSEPFPSGRHEPFVHPAVRRDDKESDDHNKATFIYVEDSDPHFLAYLDPWPPGVVVIRIHHAILYPNANYIMERIMEMITSHTRAGNDDRSKRPRGGEEEKTTTSKKHKEDWENANWNSQRNLSPKEAIQHASKPCLEAVVFDFAAVDRLDATGVHTLCAIRYALEQYTDRNTRMEWHFCQLANAHVRQLLIDAGFGTLPSMEEEDTIQDKLPAEQVDPNDPSLEEKEASSMNSSDDAYVIELEDGYLQQQKQRKNKDKNRKQLNKGQNRFNKARRPVDYVQASIQSVRDPMGIMMMDDYYHQPPFDEADALSRCSAVSHGYPLASLPVDSYPAFHWDLDSAIQSVCKRRKKAQQGDDDNNPSSITVRVD